MLPLAAVATCSPLVRSRQAAYFPPAFQSSFLDIGSFYFDYLAPMLVPLIWGAALAAVFVAKPAIAPCHPMSQHKPGIPALLAFFFDPVLLVAYLTYAHAEFSRDMQSRRR